MSNRRRFPFFEIAALFSDMTVIYCLSLFMLRNNAGISFSIGLYILCGLTVLGINMVVTRKERSVVFLSVVNAIILLFVEVLMFSTVSSTDIWWVNVVFACIFLYIVPRAFSLAIKPVSPGSVVTYCDLSFLGTSCFLIVQAADFHPGLGANLMCFAALGMNLIAMSSIRMRKISDRSSEKRLSKISLQRSMLLAAIVLGICLAAVLLGILLPEVRSSVLAVIGYVGSFFMFILDKIEAFMLYLASLLPAVDAELGSMGEGQSGNYGEEQYDDESPVSPLTLIKVIIGIAALLFLFMIFKFRKKRLVRHNAPPTVIKVENHSNSLINILKTFVMKIKDKLLYRKRLLSCYNSYEGVFARIEHRGKRYSFQRKKGQTPREYLILVMERAADAAAFHEKASVSEEDIRRDFAQLADGVDRVCFKSNVVKVNNCAKNAEYGIIGQTDELNINEAKRIMNAVKDIKRTRKHRKKEK